MRLELFIPPIRIDVHAHATNEEVIGQKLDTILEMLKASKAKEDTMLKETQDLIDEVQATKGVVESAVTLIDGLAAKIEAAKDDPVAVQAAVDELRAEKQKLADAVNANQPPTPPAPPF